MLSSCAELCLKLRKSPHTLMLQPLGLHSYSPVSTISCTLLPASGTSATQLPEPDTASRQQNLFRNGISLLMRHQPNTASRQRHQAYTASRQRHQRCVASRHYLSCQPRSFLPAASSRPCSSLSTISTSSSRYCFPLMQSGSRWCTAQHQHHQHYQLYLASCQQHQPRCFPPAPIAVSCFPPAPRDSQGKTKQRPCRQAWSREAPSPL